MPFSALFVFGDSLSDQGNVSTLTGGGVPGADYFNGGFSNGPVYTDLLAQDLSLPLTPLAAPIIAAPWAPGGGNNFAYGGALTDSHRSGLPLGLDAQVAAFLNGTMMADSDALYIVFSGANDIQAAIGAANDNPTEAQTALANPAAAIASVENAAVNVANAIVNLATAGATDFLVPNGPNWGLTPAVSELQAANPGLLGYGDFARDISVAFNNRLQIELDAAANADPSIGIIGFDFFGLLEQMVTDPANFGFSNVTDSCYSGDDLNFSGGGTACANPEEFLFWDRIHPTTAGHAIIASQFSATVITAPASIWLSLTGVLLLLLQRRSGYHRLRVAKWPRFH